MKIKRFEANDMRTALRQVQQELGADAVILSTQSAPDGVTIIAALDYDAALVPSAAENMDKIPAASATSARSAASSAALLARASGRKDAAASGGPPWTAARANPPSPGAARFVSDDDFDDMAPGEASADPVADNLVSAEPALLSDKPRDGLDRLERELRFLHRLLAEKLPDVAATMAADKVRPSALQQIGVDPALVQRIQATTMTEAGVASDAILLQDFATRIPVTLPHGSKVRAIALVGPTGAGKTTTAAKLAARHLMRYPGAQVRFVSTDTYRIGAREQLQTFARLLGTTLEVADDPQVLQTLIQTEAATDLVIVDTPGIGPRDAELAEQLPVFGAMNGLHVVLCLPASTHPLEQRRIIDRYAAAQPDGLILTKLDETYQLGAGLSVAVERDLPILWVTDGQRVPQDMHRLNPQALVARALAAREDDGSLAPGLGAAEGQHAHA
ncbi:MAG: flagellar biosynthesis protein FlhF [Oceanococcaceae bacterium]